MIKDEILQINEIIDNLNIITRWGGYSNHKTDSNNGIPYGVSLMQDCFGNTFTYDDRVETVAYFSMQPISSTTQNRWMTRLDVSYQVHIFNNLSKSGQTAKYYQKAILVMQELKKYFRDVNISTVVLNQHKVEYSVITINQLHIVPCDYSYTELEELCEPIKPSSPCPPGGDGASVTNSNETYTENIEGGGLLILPDTEYIFVVDGVQQPPLILPTLEPNQTINVNWI